ncbi:uncharacterized protein TNCV_2928061 [Trichonephila clavipes]|nr:uncharacterized protein TNCV_2928061 [Trichonephila clavipes]
MGTRLRRLKAQLKGQILSDGKCLSGKNRLTEHEIDNLQSYYGSAIRRNHSSVQNMRQAIWAIFLHKLSTDEYPQHGFCPIGEDSWCGFKKAEASGKSYKHKNSLPVAVVEAMRPIFRDLSHPDLLKKCLHGKTQNPNESFHNVVWSRVPKATFVQIETLSLGVYDAVCSFNDGNLSKLKMLQKMGVEPGEFSVSAMKLLDRERLMKAIYAFSGRSKKIRKDKRRKRKKEEDNIKKNKIARDGRRDRGRNGGPGKEKNGTCTWLHLRWEEKLKTTRWNVLKGCRAKNTGDDCRRTIFDWDGKPWQLNFD